MKLFLCGDVMTGRGIDQILAHPASPLLYEPTVRDAREYVRMAERITGRISRPVADEYIWGEALRVLEREGPDARIINLETSITECDQPWVGKAVHYRMAPANAGCLTAAGIDCCCLANNHVMDWQLPGLLETLETLDRRGIAYAGAGRNLAAADQPGVVTLPGGERVGVFGVGSLTSGIPPAWAATQDRAGVSVMDEGAEEEADRLLERIGQWRGPGDVVVVSIHWGPNWGYEQTSGEVAFAHRMIEGGVDIVHGHSSHHVKAVEIYRGRIIFYGCGDFLNDYEGIGGYEAYRPDLTAMALVEVTDDCPIAARLRLIPMQIRRFRLCRAREADGQWLARLLCQQGKPFGTTVRWCEDKALSVEGC